MILILTTKPYAIRNYPLEGTVYNILTRWNGRESAWYLDMLTQGGEALVTGIKILPYVDLLLPYSDPRLPSGALIALNINASGNRPTREGLGTETELYYNTLEEMEELKEFYG